MMTTTGGEMKGTQAILLNITKYTVYTSKGQQSYIVIGVKICSMVEKNFDNIDMTIFTSLEERSLSRLSRRGGIRLLRKE